MFFARFFSVAIVVLIASTFAQEGMQMYIYYNIFGVKTLQNVLLDQYNVENYLFYSFNASVCHPVLEMFVA